MLATTVALAGLIGLPSAAQAVTKTTTGSINAPAVATWDNNFSVSGNLNPGCAGRPVVLRDNASNAVLASTTTGSAGYFSFVNYPNPSTRTYNIRSAGFDCGRDRHTQWDSGAFTVAQFQRTSITTNGTISAPAMNNVDGSFTVSGNLNPGCSGRPVSLYQHTTAGNTWITGTNTGPNGYFSFVNVPNPNGSEWHVFSAGFDCGVTDRHEHWTSPSFRVVAGDYPTTFTSTSTPEYTESGEQWVDLSGTLSIGSPGRTVSLYTMEDGVPKQVLGTTIDSNRGFTFRLQVPVVTTYWFYSSAENRPGVTYKSAKSAEFTVKSLRLWDDFNGYADSTNPQDLVQSDAVPGAKWVLRQPDYLPGNRSLQKADTRGLGIGLVDGSTTNKSLRLKVVDANDPEPGTGLRRHLVGHIGTTKTMPAYGHFEAKIKFHKPKGAHASLWQTSGYGDGQAELDVVEWFGERDNTTQRVQHTVHVGSKVDTNGDGCTTYTMTPVEACSGPTFEGTDTEQFPEFTENQGDGSFGANPVNFGDANTWWSSWHTYEASWTQSEYRFYIDGVLVNVLKRDYESTNPMHSKFGTDTSLLPNASLATANQPGQVILSNLVNNGTERDNLLAHLSNGGSYGDFTTEVDWVRVWR
ncbi:MAG: glycoside hydrolase family 16 protein [Knoellia sp.]